MTTPEDNVPEGWTVTTLGEVAEFVNGMAAKPSEFGAGGLPIVRIKQLFDETAPFDYYDDVVPERSRLVNGDILFSWSARIDAKVWLRGPAVLNQHIFKVVPTDRVVPYWLYYILKNEAVNIARSSHGTTMKHITKPELIRHKILLPPLPVQRRIVEVIGRMDATITNLDSEIAKFTQLRKSTLESLLAAVGGEETTLGEVAKLVRGISYKSSELCDSDQGVPFVNLKSITRGGGYRDEGMKYFSGKVKDAQNIRAGDLLIAITDLTQDKALVGAPVRLPSNRVFENATFSLDLAKLVIDESVADTGFIESLLRSDAVRTFMKARSNGSTVSHLQVKLVPTLPILLPSLEDQRKVVDIMSTLDTHLENLKAEVASLRQVRTAYLNDLLTGQVEVPESIDALIA